MATVADIQFSLGGVKEAHLDKQFLISKDAIYDYYSTNSGIYPKNQVVKGSGGDDDDPTPSEEKTNKELTEDVDKLYSHVNSLKTSLSSSVATASNIEENKDKYEEVDDILDSVITLKKSIQKLS